MSINLKEKHDKSMIGSVQKETLFKKKKILMPAEWHLMQ